MCVRFVILLPGRVRRFVILRPARQGGDGLGPWLRGQWDNLLQGDGLDSAHADAAVEVPLPGREGDGRPLLLPKAATLSRVIPGREGDGCPLLLP